MNRSSKLFRHPSTRCLIRWGLLACGLGFLAPSALMAQGTPLELLGKTLFWEEQLSSSGTVACGTCHQPAVGGTDPRAARPATGQDPRESGSLHPGYDGLFGTPDDAVGSPGVVGHRADGSPIGGAFAVRPQTTGRKSSSNLTAAFHAELFWDGRAGGALVDPLTGTTVQAFGAAIETQALGPPVSDVEMAHLGESWASVAARIQGARPLASASRLPADVASFIGTDDYPGLFGSAFGTPAVTPVRIAQALGAYQRSLAVFDTPFDRYQAGNASAMSAEQVRGLQVFLTQARCAACHVPSNAFTDDSFHVLGLRPVVEDDGRRSVTGQEVDRGAFKTPSLYNTALHRTWFHNGSASSLAEVVEVYDQGGGPFGDNLDPAIFPLGLTANEKQELVAFLQALTDPRVAAEQYPFDRPLLGSETGAFGEIIGAGTGGPRAVLAHAPGLGNGRFGFTVRNIDPTAVTLWAADTQRAAPGGVNVGGITLHLGLSQDLVIGNLRPVTVDPMEPQRGFAWENIPVPADLGLVGVQLHAQWLSLTPSGVVNASDAIGFRVF